MRNHRINIREIIESLEGLQEVLYIINSYLRPSIPTHPRKTELKGGKKREDKIKK